MEEIVIKKIEKCSQNKNRKLDLSNLSLEYLPEKIYEFFWLQELNVRGNFIKEIDADIKKLIQLEFLDFSENRLIDIPIQLSLIGNLRKLWLVSYKIIEFPKFLKKLRKLKELNLTNNAISKIPDEITEFYNLTHLYLNINNLKEIPEQLKELKRIEVLGISDNRLTQIPSTLRECNLLRKLYLSQNKIEGIPEDILAINYLDNSAYEILDYLKKENRT